MLNELVAELRNYEGLRRKKAIGSILNALGNKQIYEDAGLIRQNEWNIVASIDGITEKVVQENPWHAGYYSVVANVADVVAKGARPLGYMNIISSESEKTRIAIAKGIKFGLQKYGLINLKGHTHPDSTYDAVDGCVIGIGKHFIPGNAARADNNLIMAIDLEGEYRRNGWVRSFDSVYHKNRTLVLSRLEGIIQLAEQDLVTSAKDISCPGILGTIGMLCEASGIGAEICLQSIPRPKSVPIGEWLRVFPSTGFIFSTMREKACIRVLEEHGLTAKTIGTISRNKSVTIKNDHETATFIDLNKDSLFS